MLPSSSIIRVFIAVLCIAFIEMNDDAFAQTDIAPGNVLGSWTKAGSPYRINGEITVPNGETLIIEPGVTVVFTGHYKFNVHGRLLAIGVSQDSILFTAQDSSVGWRGIRFDSTPSTNDSSKIIYCTIQYGRANTGSYNDQSGGAIFVLDFNKLQISNCLLHHNMNSGIPDYTGGGAVCFYNASPILKHCTISGNSGTTGGGILCWTNADALIADNIISNNSGFDGGGIYVGYSVPLLINNIIVGNSNTDNGGGIRFHASNARFFNNTIAFNTSSIGGGIDCYNGSKPIIFNTIVFGNTAGDGASVYLGDSNSDPQFSYCDVEGGKVGFRGPGADVNYTGVYEYNIDANPKFVSAATGDYHLAEASPCIAVGNDSIRSGVVWYAAPALDCEGNARPNPTGSRPDIGALESPLGTATSAAREETGRVPDRLKLDQNFPNPFNPTTVVRYQLPVVSHVRLSVFDMLGREVRVLVDEKKEAGYHEVRFDGSGLASGVYLYCLQAGEFVQTRKLLLMR